ncbi:hypothetical protein GCM10011511_07150 [Puia dinghuensis]|uniref:Uncharacterized protein n=1 Tax=Puia dinghuensis TaxID=1792502 RepID=A0A8J2U8P8_9BACT|nr:hypothetical protein GCM10011511_07150 [Puia dinghuensis]
MQDVKRLIAGHPEKPAGWVCGDAPVLPLAERLRKGILHHILGQIDIVNPKDARQDGYQFPGLVPEKMVHELVYGWLVHRAKYKTVIPEISVF